eukprot:scaffold3220_cov20-Prasinocladus_malaysianus.AAC.1
MEWKQTAYCSKCERLRCTQMPGRQSLREEGTLQLIPCCYRKTSMSTKIKESRIFIWAHDEQRHMCSYWRAKTMQFTNKIQVQSDRMP